MTLVAVAGAVANKHRHGGSIWVRMSWAEGLRRLGFDVLFVEEIAAAACVGADGSPAPLPDCGNAAVFDAVMEAFGFAGSAALVCPEAGAVHGMSRETLLERADTAALLVNIGGNLRWPSIRDRIARSAYVDLDPGYTQIWHASGGWDSGLETHDLHFTVGVNVGTPRCALPTGGLRWRPVRQPVVLERWPVAAGERLSAFTTVASWRGAYGRVSWGGRDHGLKAHEFRRFLELPRRVPVPFEVVLDIHPDEIPDLARLREHGWRLRSPADVAAPASFRDFVQASGAEFSAAQGVYVETRSGWFSDRTVRYLASGRPALVQDTGFRDDLPVGEGLIAFSDAEEAVAGARALAGEYTRHRAAARRIAEDHFAPERALGPLLADAGVAP